MFCLNSLFCLPNRLMKTFKVFFWILLFLFSSLMLNAQQTTSTNHLNVVGKIVYADNGKPLVQATIQLLNANDSSIVMSTTSGNEGTFTLSNVRKRDYILKVSFLSCKITFQNITSQLFVGKEIVIPTIEMEELSVMLSEAVVLGKIPEVIVKEDTLEYNPSSYRMQGNAVVEDMLKKLPGVEVDMNGQITVAGKEVKRVLVDGENFFGNDPTLTTKNLEIDIIDKLQIIDKKSDLEELTGITDGEREVVINITIKKDKKKGWINNIEAGAGNLVKDVRPENIRYASKSNFNKFSGDDKYSFIVNANNNTERREGIITTNSFGLNLINIFSKKYKMTGSITYNMNDDFVQSNSLRQNILVDSVSFRENISELRSKTRNVSLNYRLEYKPTESTTILFTPNISYINTNSNDTSYTATKAGDNNRTEVNNSSRRGASTSDNIRMSGRLILSQRFSKKGRRVTLSLQGNFNNNERFGSNISTNNFLLRQDKNKLLNQESEIISQSLGYTLNASYIEPVFSSSFLQLSYTLRDNKSDNLRSTFDFDPLTQDFTTLNKNYSKSLQNDFVNQTYSFSFRTAKPKYTYSVGVNVEPSLIKSKSFIINGISEGIDSILHDPGSRNVINYAPTTEVVYRFGKQSNIRFTYLGKTAQPTIVQLDPTENITNPLNIRSGNPDLLPSFSNNFSFQLNSFNRVKQKSLKATLDYSFIMNEIINKTTYEANTGVQQTFPVNQNGIWSASATLLFNTPIDKAKMFQFSTNTDFNYRNQIGYLSLKKDSELQNVAKTFNVRENVSVSYRRQWLFVQLRSIVRYSSTLNSIKDKKNMEDVNYRTVLNTQISLPSDWTILSGIQYSGQTGLSSGFNKDETLWDIEVSKRLMKKKQASLHFKWTDIFQQKLSISRRVTSNFIEDYQSNVLTGYFLVTFSYRFNSMGGGSIKRGNKKKNPANTDIDSSNFGVETDTNE